MAHWEAKLRPASDTVIVENLLRCLTLVAPSGMTQADREEWLAVAMPEVERMPENIFLTACANARKTCDHPAKIIATIMKYEPPYYATEASIRRTLSHARAKLENIDAPRLAQTDTANPDERRKVAASMADLVKELEAKARDQVT